MAKDNGKKPETTEAPKMSLKDQQTALKALFKDYDAANAKVDSARRALETAMRERSGVVERIAGVSPQGVKRAGKDLKIMTRKSSKNPDAPPTWFFRGETESELPSVD